MFQRLLVHERASLGTHNITRTTIFHFKKALLILSSRRSDERRAKRQKRRRERDQSNRARARVTLAEKEREREREKVHVGFLSYTFFLLFFFK